MHGHLLRQQWYALGAAQAYNVLQTALEAMNHLVTVKKLLFSKGALVGRTANGWTHVVKVRRRHWLRPSLGLCHHQIAQQRGHKGQRIPHAEQGRGVEVHHEALCGGHPQMPAAAKIRLVVRAGQKCCQ